MRDLGHCFTFTASCWSQLGSVLSSQLPTDHEQLQLLASVEFLPNVWPLVPGTPPVYLSLCSAIVILNIMYSHPSILILFQFSSPSKRLYL